MKVHNTMLSQTAIRSALVMIAFTAIECAAVNTQKTPSTHWESDYAREIEIAPNCQCASFNRSRQPGATLSNSSYWIYLKVGTPWQGEIPASRLLLTDRRNRPEHPWYVKADLTHPWNSPLRGTIMITEKWIELKLSVPLYDETGRITGYTPFESNGTYELAK